jgi:hypothetical protein
VLLVTTTVGMVDGVHCYTSDNGPFVTLSLIFMVSTTSLKDRLVGSTTAGYKANSGSVGVLKSHLGAGRHADSGDTLIVILGHDDGIVARGLGELAAVTGLGLDVADNGSLGDGRERKDVTNGKTSCILYDKVN